KKRDPRKNATPSVYKTDAEKKGAKALKYAFSNNKATVILLSCSTGQLGGIGEQVSKLREDGVEVIAPTDTTNIGDIIVERSETGALHFQVEYALDSGSNTFLDGQVVSTYSPLSKTQRAVSTEFS